MNAIVREVIAQADQAKADYEQWEYQRAQQQRIVRKDFGNSDLRTSQPQQQAATMSDEDSAAWNAWGSAVARREALEAIKNYDHHVAEHHNKLVADLENFNEALQ